MPCEPQIIKYCHPHLETASLFPNVGPRGKSQTLATRTPETPKSLPAGLQPCISLWSFTPCSWMDVKMENGHPPAPCSTILSQELFWMDIPQTAPFSSSSFSLPPSLQPRISLLHTWEIPPPLDPTCSLLLRLRRSWYILSESICGKRRMDWILLTFWICIYLCAVVVFVERLSRRSEANVVSCLVWIQADSDLLGSCYISHCCNVMGCEPQGQFASSCVCVCLFHIVCTSFLCLSFSVPVFFSYIYSHVCIAFSLCLAVPVYLCVCAWFSWGWWEIQRLAGESLWPLLCLHKFQAWTLCKAFSPPLVFQTAAYTHTQACTLLCSFHFHIIHYYKDLL